MACQARAGGRCRPAAPAADQGEAAAVPTATCSALPGKQDKWLKQLSAEKWGEQGAGPAAGDLAEHASSRGQGVVASSL